MIGLQQFAIPKVLAIRFAVLRAADHVRRHAFDRIPVAFSTSVASEIRRMCLPFPASSKFSSRLDPVPHSCSPLRVIAIVVILVHRDHGVRRIDTAASESIAFHTSH